MSIQEYIALGFSRENIEQLNDVSAVYRLYQQDAKPKYIGSSDRSLRKDLLNIFLKEVGVERFDYLETPFHERSRQVALARHRIIYKELPDWNLRCLEVSEL